jgi:signal transduction histidine kinase
LFASLRLNIFIYYFVTVVVFVSIGYYFLMILEVSNLFLLGSVFLCFVILSGIFISKLAVDPLKEYITNLQNLSKETLHELNLPVSTIKTNSQMLKRNLEDAKSLKRIDRIESACDMLQERYNELEYMIKMQSRENIEEPFLLNDLIEERVAFVSRVYPHMEFVLSLRRVELKSDKKGLSKVIDNIIDNGVKYSKASKKIDIRIEKSSLFVQDYGIGMDEVELLAIFDNYYQSNANMQGFGIGLSMVKRFCDKNNILLSFHSKKEHGTRVELDFKNIIGN